MNKPALRKSLLFTAASGLGLLVDLILALLLTRIIGLSLPLSAAMSFVTVAIINYILFEFVVFRHEDARAHLGRAVGVLGASTSALIARILVIELVIRTLGDPQAIWAQGLTLVLGAGASFIVNFLINQRFVFSGR